MTCPTCHYPRIPGITSCVNCGDVDDGDYFREPEPEAEQPPNIGVASDSQVAAWVAENAAARELSRALTEARALEYAGDSGAACRIYEALVARGCGYTPPYRRLAIIYRKAKDRAAEERVVRSALGHLSSGPNGWFIVRLAKILSERRATEGA